MCIKWKFYCLKLAESVDHCKVIPNGAKRGPNQSGHQPHWCPGSACMFFGWSFVGFVILFWCLCFSLVVLCWYLQMCVCVWYVFLVVWWLALVVAVVFTSVCLCLISCGVHVFVFGVHLYAVALVSMKCTAVAMVERLCGGKTSDS